MANIIVIGAGQGGLVAAKFLSEKGHNVTVFEKNPKLHAFYPWRDDIRRAIFEECGLTPLPAEDCVQKSKWLFVSPDENYSLHVPMTPPLEEISISREYLFNRLVDECTKCTFHFDTEIIELLVENEKIIGVITQNGEKFYCDLVIDSSGLTSVLKSFVPKKFGIKPPQKEDIMMGYRGIYPLNDDVPLPSPPCTMYIKHLDACGISWCNLTPDNTADILIGRIGGCDKKEIDDAIIKIQSNHAFCGKIPISSRYVNIALRYPSPCMVADGYVIIGDAAFMSMPLMGSGIESSMLAGKMLADIIDDKNTFTAAELYPYQQEFFKKFGFDYVFIDIVKRWALSLPSEIINKALKTKLVSDADMALVSTDSNAQKISPSVIFKKIIPALKNLKLLCKATKYLLVAFKAKVYAKKMPKAYSEKALRVWSTKLERQFQRFYTKNS